MMSRPEEVKIRVLCSCGHGINRHGTGRGCVAVVSLRGLRGCSCSSSPEEVTAEKILQVQEELLGKLRRKTHEWRNLSESDSLHPHQRSTWTAAYQDLLDLIEGEAAP